MIEPTGYVLRCEQDDCVERRYNSNPFRLRDAAREEGWQFHVKLDGQQAIRGGKDYCPEHRKGGGNR